MYTFYFCAQAKKTVAIMYGCRHINDVNKSYQSTHKTIFHVIQWLCSGPDVITIPPNCPLWRVRMHACVSSWPISSTTFIPTIVHSRHSYHSILFIINEHLNERDTKRIIFFLYVVLLAPFKLIISTIIHFEWVRRSLVEAVAPLHTIKG